MKTFSFLIFIFMQIFIFSNANAAASSSKNLGVDLGLGFISNYGLIGGGVRYFISDSQDLHVNTGIDLNGFIVGAGSRFYTQSGYDKCFFVFSCKSKYFIGGTLIRSNGSTITVDGDGVKGDYKQSDGFAGNLAVGSYDVFGDSFTMGLEVGYRAWMKRPDITFQSGTYLQKHKTDLEKYGENSVNVALTFGWLF
jgi:hypothetical protein